MFKSCVVICIQNNFQVLGLRLKAKGNEKYFAENQFAGTYLKNDGPGEMLQLAMDSLNAQSCDRIILTGQIEQSGVFEIRMPKLNYDELRHAVEYELTKHIPLPSSDIVWSARVVPDENEDSEEHLNRVRVVFMLRDNWTKFISELQIRGLNIDIFVNPFMSIDPFADGENVALPMIDDEYVFLSNSDGLRKMSFAENIVQDEAQKKQILDCFVWDKQEAVEKYFICMLVARYVISGEYDKYEKKLVLKLPQSLIPQRNKVLKWLTVISGIAALLCVDMLLYQAREKVYCVYSEQKNAINLVETQIENLQKQNAVSKKNEKLYKKINGSVPANLNPLRVMAFLAQKLPKFIWIRSYNMTSDKIHLSLTSSKDPGNLMSKLRNGKLYNIENIRKSRRHDGTYYLYLMLASPDTGDR
ncbi:MAG: hypothetical protein P9M03_07565 [Candidatus Theseobacter exili]|nr:hypothetical protein [Candidatus Theseobacter exili]